MKKIVSIIIVFLVLFMSFFTVNIYAATLDSINITTDKQTVHPNENVTVNIDFGESLGAYTANVAYDSNLLEYVSSEGGTANDTGDKVIVYYYDQTGGTSPRTTMSVTFKAKDGLTTSNPTNFSITLEGLANEDASVTYDDITVPIVKDIVVEPRYVDYDIALQYTGDIIENVEKDMKIAISSSMGRNYAHTRIIAEVTAPAGENVKLLATDNQTLEHDIIQSGWGSAEGDPIGGENVAKEIMATGLFSGSGDYSITLKLINRDNSDEVIASKTFNFNVKEETVITPPSEEEVPPTEGVPPTDTEDNTNNNENNNQSNNTGNNQNTNEKNEVVVEKEEEPKQLPKTGNNVYFIAIPIILLLLAVSYFSFRKRV